jgi:drug/metabolite transporter superfamily protein YnfA
VRYNAEVHHNSMAIWQTYCMLALMIVDVMHGGQLIHNIVNGSTYARQTGIYVQNKIIRLLVDYIKPQSHARSKDCRRNL